MFIRNQSALRATIQQLSKPFSSLTIAGEPTAPKMLTAFPGPKNQQHLADLGKVTCNLTPQMGFFVDMSKSKGNFIADVDGNQYLDLFMNISSTAMGHNHPDVLDFVKSDKMAEIVANRTAQGFHPRGDHCEMLQQGFIDVAPPGLDMVAPAMCGSCAVETAFKYAIINYAGNQRGGIEVMPNEEEMLSCMKNEMPGSKNNYAIMSFNSGFHGRMFGSLSASRTKSIHKVDMPAFDWPAADPPVYKYPLEDNAEYNRKQDDESLRGVELMIDEWKKEKGIEVVCLAIEPIMAEGGDLQISGYFANGIRKLTKDRGIYMMVDEVQTGVVTSGTFWAHEQWDLYSPPDFMTFAKKMQATGFYHSKETSMKTVMRHHNTWMGDPVRAMLAVNQNNMIKRDNLLENAIKTGAQLREGLNDMAKEFPEWVKDVRGRGTCLSFSVENEAQRPTMLAALRKKGVNQNVCGATGIRLRPSLYFTDSHASMYLDLLRETVMDLSNTRHAEQNLNLGDRQMKHARQVTVMQDEEGGPEEIGTANFIKDKEAHDRRV